MRLLATLAVLAVAACGADGEPEPIETGISVSAEARIGVSGTF